MAEIFISCARETSPTAQRVADALKDAGYLVWWDAELPAHRAFHEVIDERLRSASVVLVLGARALV